MVTQLQRTGWVKRIRLTGGECMSALDLSDRLALDLLSRDIVLDALREWAESGQKRYSLSDVLWKALENFASNKYVDQSQGHIRELTADFRRNPGQPLMAALQHMVRKHFVWHDRALLRYESVLQTQFWLAKCNPVQPQCYLWAIDAPTRSSSSHLRRLPDELRREFYSNAPLLPEVDEWNLHALRHLGLAEIHRHLNGSALPNVLWSYLLSAPHKVPVGSLAGEVDRLESTQLVALLYTASDLRSALLARLLRSSNEAGESEMEWFDGWSDEVKVRLRNMYRPIVYRHDRYRRIYVSGFPRYRDAAARLPQALDHPLSAERALLVRAFEHIHSCPSEVVFLAALHAYVVIQNLVWRALTKPREYAKGFDRFERYHGMFLRNVEKAGGRVAPERYLDRLLQAQRTGGVRWAELRVVPASSEKGGPLRDVRNLDRALHKPDLRDLFQTGSNKRLPATSVQSGTAVGLIFHFIKRKDDAVHGTGRWPCRHVRLRRDVRKQALAIGRVRRNQGLGNHIVGIDAAGPEIYAGPEVFAPAINWLRAQPTLGLDPKWMRSSRGAPSHFPQPLGLTYHVGEDFRHLLSGLRTVDEALRFLGMHSGDRIGHGLALGLEYKDWCRRVGDLVVMPRGQRLDDLVWMRTRLASANSRFAGCLFEIDEEIEQLAREIYLPSNPASVVMPSLQAMYQAWKMRGYDPLWVNNRSLPVNIAVRDSPQLMRQAFSLYYDYHFNAGQRLRYNEPVRVPLSYRLDDWHLMITWLQDLMLREVVRRRVAIEINPTSNLCIGSLDRMTEHPVFRWHPPEQSSTAIRPEILVGSDDPGVFGTELLFEYAALSRAAEERGATPREISAWLGELRESSRKYCFLDTRD